MDTLAQRWARLSPHAVQIGPDDGRPRPAVLLFHGCGGMRPHLPLYAQAARDAGWRAFVIDSYAPRGWGRTRALTTVCSGLSLRGHARAGDVLAAIHGVASRPDVDARRLALAGWSHGGWSIMEALSCDAGRPRAADLADAAACDLSGVRAVWLAYPYVGPLAPNRNRPWRCKPRVAAALARRDHLTTVGNARRVFDAARLDADIWVAEGTHAFDEPTGAGPMRHDPELTRQAVARFAALLERA